MKKLLIIIAAIAINYSIIMAQTEGIDTRTELKLGIKIGLNHSNVYDAQGENFNADAKFGLAIGSFLAIPLGKYLGLQPEVLFSQKGFQASGTILGGNYGLTRTSTYLDVPLFLSLKPTNNITFLAGPQYSYLIKQKDVFTNGVSTVEQQQEFQNDNLRKNILSFGIGADFRLDHIVLGLRSCWDVQKNNGDGTSNTPRYKNVWYQATIGYIF